MKKKYPIIIIEGVDGSGKTTTCNLLSKELNLPVIKLKNVPKYFTTNIEEVSRVFNETVEQFKSFSFILDRGLVSSIIYSRVYGRKDNLDYIFSLFGEIKPKIFILTADEKTLFERKPEDEIIDIEKRKKLDLEYRKLSNYMRWELIDTSEKTPEVVCKEIIDKLQ